MSQRLSRKEIKRDEFMESVGGAFDYVQSHAGKLALAAGVAVVGLLVAGLIVRHGQRQEERAGEALAAALKVVEAEIDPVTANPEGGKSPTFASAAARRERAKGLLSSVRDEFGSTDGAAIAAAYLGQIAVEEGDMPTARSYWEAYLNEGGDSSLAVEVELNLMALDRAEGKGDELVTSLRARLSGDDALPADLLLHELGVTLESLDRQAEAEEAFQRLIEEFPQSAFAADARRRTGGSSTPPLFGS